MFEKVKPEEWKDYKWQLKNRIRDPLKIADYFNLSKEEREWVLSVSEVYTFGVTPYYLSLSDPKDPEDPIRKQILPSPEEIDPHIQRYGEENPFNEEKEIKGLTHRYRDRVLMVVTTACATYCRHCMRKRIFKEGERAFTKEEIDRMIEYIEAHKDIRDVLISGGDPLILDNERIEYILKRLRSIKHVDIIRFGTRLPVLLPQRFYDRQLLKILEKYGPIWVNTHFNHPKEVTKEAEEAVFNLLKHGVPVNNQTVLLKGVNDDGNIMLELFRKLLKIRVKPQYLFHCDPVKGVMHFRTTIDKGLEIMEFLRGKISGMGIPTYAIDLPGGKGKVPLLPKYAEKIDGDVYTFKGIDGSEVVYCVEEIRKFINIQSFIDKDGSKL